MYKAIKTAIITMFIVSLISLIVYYYFFISEELYKYPDHYYTKINGLYYIIFQIDFTRDLSYLSWIFLSFVTKINGILIFICIFTSLYVFKRIVFPFIVLLFSHIHRILEKETFKQRAFKVSIAVVVFTILFQMLTNCVGSYYLELAKFSDYQEHYEKSGVYFTVTSTGEIIEVFPIIYWLFYFFLLPVSWTLNIPCIVCLVYLYFRHLFPYILSKSKIWIS